MSCPYPAPCMLSAWLRLRSMTVVHVLHSSTPSALHTSQTFLRATRAYSRTLKLWLRHHCSAMRRACFRSGACRERMQTLPQLHCVVGQGSYHRQAGSTSHSSLDCDSSASLVFSKIKNRFPGPLCSSLPQCTSTPIPRETWGVGFDDKPAF